MALSPHVPYRISNPWTIFAREWEFWVLEVLLFIFGGYFFFFLYTYPFVEEPKEVALEPFVRIEMSSPGPKIADVEPGGEGDLLPPKKIGKREVAKKAGKTVPAKVKVAPKKNPLDQSLVGVIASRSRTADSAFGRILQKSGIGNEVDRVLKNVKRDYSGKGTGDGQGSGVAGGSRGGDGKLTGSEFGVPGGTGTGYGIGTGYGGGGDNVSLGVRTAHKVVAKLTQGRASIEGSLDAAIIDRVVRENLGGLKYCYERELTKNPKLGGKIVVQFTIGSTGGVTEANIETSSVSNAEVEDCIIRRVKRWLFPKPQGGLVVVSYPFVFTPGS